MGNRSYLLTDDQCQLFEANNTLPIFWILGGCPQPFEAKIAETANLSAPEEQEGVDEDTYEELYLDWFTTHQIGDVQLSIQAYADNLENNRDYIETVYSSLTEVFDAFVKVINQQKEYNPEATIIIDYGQMIGFYEDHLEFYRLISLLIKQIENKEENKWIFPEDALGSTIGSDEYSNHQGETLFTRESYQKLNSTLMKSLRKEQGASEPAAKQSSLLQKFFSKLKK
ncbi:hypothetical protein [Enterococcus sp. AZ072]|uniref:hypothetical protein n=1 Tax=unclassified Enterococcus TaxID=2608891 RepID=UPI003D26B14C